ncbi:MAG TPA: hydroxymethylglutaryl-CoA reductase, degradative [Anaerolineaceae bacterium]|nr:hydroxymethylglutaryl-CoA reductase, degradative [Anaerolineaceae bacterium]
MTKKFYQLSLTERHQYLQDHTALTASDLQTFTSQKGLSPERADAMVENAVGVFSLPIGIAQNFVVNGKAVLVPMVLEEPSVIAGASFMARLAQKSGGFTASMSSQQMIGQLQLLDLKDPEATAKIINENKDSLLKIVNDNAPRLVQRGGGARDIETRLVQSSPIGPFLVIHLILDVRDAMGANAINTALEQLAEPVAKLTGGRVHLKILSNLADKRLATAEATFALETLAFDSYSGETVRDGILEAWAFAVADPYRAATHNKGIMNGIDAVVLATGNDWRAIEAGAHAYAARDGGYTSLSQWRKDENGNLHGKLTLPMAVGIVGGATRVHPTAQANLKLMGVRTAEELGEIIVSVGLAQNLAAMRALATEGIQRGHMSLHARQIALAAGANASQAQNVADQMVRENAINAQRAQEILKEMKEDIHD